MHQTSPFAERDQVDPVVGELSIYFKTTKGTNLSRRAETGRHHQHE